MENVPSLHNSVGYMIEFTVSNTLLFLKLSLSVELLFNSMNGGQFFNFTKAGKAKSSWSLFRLVIFCGWGSAG